MPTDWRLLEHFEKYSVEKEIKGSEESVQVRVPPEELLIAVKLHSGRLTDTRDVVALIENADLEKVDDHIDRGDPEKLKEILENIQQTVADSSFEDSFKGVFSQNSLSERQILKLQEYLQKKT